MTVESLEDRTVPSGVSLVDSTFYGGFGDQRGTGISYNGGALYLSGNLQPETQSPGANALVSKFAIPTTNGATPVWSRTFDAGTNFFGIAATNEGVYPVGWNYSLSSDSVGGKEVKSILAKFAPNGSSGGSYGGSQWVRTPNIFGYNGVESFQTATAADIGGNTYLYVGGGGQPFSYYAYTVAKYDTAGNLLAIVADPFMSAPFGGSETRGIAVLNNNVYAAGNTNWGSPTPQHVYPILTKYDANLGFIQQMRDTALTGGYNAVTAFGGALFAAGYSNTAGVPNSENYLVEKYDEAGNLQWRSIAGGAGIDVLTGIVGVGSSVYAVGYSTSGGGGGKDAVVVEIDATYGTVLSITYFGGAQDDQANGIVSNGTDLYVVGESRSFAQGGNLVGQNDLVLSHFTTNTVPVANTGGPYTITEGQDLMLDASGSFDPDMGDAIVSYAWDLDGDNDFDDVVTVNPTATVTWASLVAMGISDGLNPAVPQTIAVRVTDTHGATSDGFTTFTLTNAAPTVTSFTATGGVNGNTAVVGNPVAFQISLTDPSPVDLTNSFTYEVTWGDSSPNTFVTGGTTVSATHTYNTAGNFTPTVVATDKDAGTSSPAFNGPTLTVTAIQVIDGNLVIAGTSGGDNISVNSANPANITVHRNGANTTWTGVSGRIVIRGGDGVDVVTVSGSVPTEIFGGNGNDYLYGGGGNDQIWGGAGDDNLSLGSGNDVGIGGFGRDLLYGGNNNDVLVGGQVDPLLWDWTALQTVSTDWHNNTNPLTAPASAQALAAATTDPAIAAEYDRYWGNTGKDLFVYRSGLGGDQVNSFSATERDYLLALMP